VSTWSFHASIAGDRLLGPYCLPPRLSVAVYNDFLRNIILELSQDEDLHARIHLWLMHDGASPHFLLALREFLRNVFLEQRRGRGGPTAWPARPLTEIPYTFISGNT
jgi:hypothetical protein